LAGWSYGGTVVAEIAQHLRCLAEPSRIIVKNVILFDAPLRRSVEFDKHDRHLLAQHEKMHSKLIANKTKADKSCDVEEAEGDGFDENEANAHQHYLDCTRLLHQYHLRPTLQMGKLNPSNDTCGSMLTCPILDIRPDGLNGSDDGKDLSELTSDKIHMKTLFDCSHFTMLLGLNAKRAAELAEEFYGEQP